MKRLLLIFTLLLIGLIVQAGSPELPSARSFTAHFETVPVKTLDGQLASSFYYFLYFGADKGESACQLTMEKGPAGFGGVSLQPVAEEHLKFPCSCQSTFAGSGYFHCIIPKVTLNYSGGPAESFDPGSLFHGSVEARFEKNKMYLKVKPQDSDKLLIEDNGAQGIFDIGGDAIPY